jgi:hypothetical protein
MCKVGWGEGKILSLRRRVLAAVEGEACECCVCGFYLCGFVGREGKGMERKGSVECECSGGDSRSKLSVWS